MKNKILIITIIAITSICLYCTNSFAIENGTVRMQIVPNDTDHPTWTNINISESYAECESLNSSTSTLGTTSLQAHLTTDADWSAMAIFSVSQYGGQTANSPTWTNGNITGIKDIGGTKQATGIADLATKNSVAYVSGLFNDDGSVKKYVKQWNSDRTKTNFVGFIDTWGWKGSNTSWSPRSYSPCILHTGFFGINSWDSGTSGVNGCPNSSVTFRPVIWN